MKVQIPELFIKDFQIKLGSILLAILLWFFVVVDLEYFDDINLPIVIEGVPAGKALSIEIPETATARFRGQGNSLLWAEFTMPVSEAALVLDVSKIHATEKFHLDRYFAENPDKVRLPRDFQLELIHVVQPESLWVSVEERAVKEFSVQIAADIQPAVGYMMVGDIHVDPMKIQVEGPASLLDELESLRVPPLNLRDVNLDVDQVLPIEISPAQLFTIRQPTVHVHADIQSIGTVAFSGVNVRLENVPRGIDVAVIPATINLEAEGGLDRLLELNPEDFTLFFDYARNWNPDQQLYPLEYILPDGVQRISKLEPAMVEVVQQ